MDTTAYLKRIGAAAWDGLSVPSLRSLVRAHLEQVPFENLDLAGHARPLSLAEEDLFDKVVRRGRGGYCFELNKLFYLLLVSLGFACCPVAARIVYRREDPRPLSHRATVVRLDGKEWLCDVGYGGPGPKGLLCLSTEGPQEIAGETFSVAREGARIVVFRHDPDCKRPLIVFQDEPWPEVDFETIHGYYSLHPASVFTQKLIVYRCTPDDGQLSLVGDVFRTERAGRVLESRNISDSGERGRVLRDVFGLNPDGLLDKPQTNKLEEDL